MTDNFVPTPEDFEQAIVATIFEWCVYELNGQLWLAREGMGGQLPSNTLDLVTMTNQFQTAPGIFLNITKNTHLSLTLLVEIHNAWRAKQEADLETAA